MRYIKNAFNMDVKAKDYIQDLLTELKAYLCHFRQVLHWVFLHEMSANLDWYYH